MNKEQIEETPSWKALKESSLQIRHDLILKHNILAFEKEFNVTIQKWKMEKLGEIKDDYAYMTAQDKKEHVLIVFIPNKKKDGAG